MNKKILGLALAITFLAMLVAPVLAGKGNSKLSYEARFVLGAPDSMTMRSVPPEGDANVNFISLVYSAPVPLFIFKIDGTEYPAIYTEAKILVIRRVGNPFRLVKATETYTFDGIDGSLVVRVTGRTNGMGTPDQMDIVNVEGHGTGYFKGVKISAKGYSPLGETTLKIHEGTIMGWSGLPT